MPVPNSLIASLTISLALTATATALADEGMWMPSQMPELVKPMREAGFQDDPQALTRGDTATAECGGQGRGRDRSVRIL
ncbi:hypothetical protein CEK64_04850 [Xanthomonas sontii]|nr:hypothetical protein CEK64_04850 [Xanthomonas sontii]